MQNAETVRKRKLFNKWQLECNYIVGDHLETTFGTVWMQGIPQQTQYVGLAW